MCANSVPFSGCCRVCLLISIWGNKKLGTAEVEGQRELHSCMKFLRYAETSILLAGRLWYVHFNFGVLGWRLNRMYRDILVEMSTQGQLPLPSTVSIFEPVSRARLIGVFFIGLYAYTAPDEPAER